MGRVYNFAAGPAMLPLEVLEEAQRDLVDYKGTGMSVMEMSHRGKVFDGIIKQAEADFRTLVGVPDNYYVLFLQGGGSQQFAEVPLNLMKNKKAGYVITGNWAKKAWQEAQKYGDAVALASSADKNFTYIPDCSDLPITEDMDYVYICENNTIYGTEYFKLPNTKGKDLVADVSDLVRTDLPEEVPTMLRYSTQAEKDSLYNTPPCWQIYICGLVFKWLLKMGGLTEMNRRNEAKAKVFYDALDASSLFKGTVRKEDRSLMNAPFVTGDKDLDAEFVKEAAEQGLVSLKGHRTVGGMRASMYNAMPIEGVEKLAAFMREFEAKHPVLD